MTEPQQDREIVVDAIAEGLLPLVTLVQSDGMSVDVTSAKRWLNPDGSVFALVTWTEWPRDGSGWGGDDVSELFERCGFQIEYGKSAFAGEPGAYRVSKDGAANIIGEDFFDDMSADTDAAFEEFMTTALRPDFPHPFMVSTTCAREHIPELVETPHAMVASRNEPFLQPDYIAAPVIGGPITLMRREGGVR